MSILEFSNRHQLAGRGAGGYIQEEYTVSPEIDSVAVLWVCEMLHRYCHLQAALRTGSVCRSRCYSPIGLVNRPGTDTRLMLHRRHTTRMGIFKNRGAADRPGLRVICIHAGSI